MEKDAILKKLLGKGSAAAMIRLSSAALNFAALAMVARSLGAEEYGAFALMFSIGVTTGLSATGGRHLLALRRLPALEAPELRGEAARLARAGYGFIVLAALAAALAMVLLARIEATALAGLARALLYAGALALPHALAEYQVHLLRAKGEVVTALTPRDIVWYAAIILFSVVAIERGAPMPRAETAFVWISAMLGVLVLLQGGLVLRALPLCAGPVPAAAPLPAADWRRQLGWLWASTVAEAMQRNIVVMVAGFFLFASDVGALFSARSSRRTEWRSCCRFPLSL